MRRRDLLATAALALAAPGRLMSRSTPFQNADAKTDEQRVADATRSLRDAGIDPVRAVVGPNFIAVGDAPQSFIKQALDLCEALARDYLGHFTARGFAVEKPAAKLLIVPLTGPESFAKVAGVPIDEAVGGQYERDTNRLVLFDNRARDIAGPAAARANTVALMHEATHQLCFNTGLLDRLADTPLAVSEGLACYGETRRPDGRVKIGAVNADRLAALDQGPAGRLLSLADLIRDDSAFENPTFAQQVYTRSWLLVHTLMEKPDSVTRFKVWLDAIRTRKGPSHRLDDARAALGDLEALDRDLIARAHARAVRR